MDYTPITDGSLVINTFLLPLIAVSIEDDPFFENDETFFVNFTGCSPGCMVSSTFVEVTIESDDGK